MSGKGGFRSLAAGALIATVVVSGTAWADAYSSGGKVYQYRDRAGVSHFTNVPSHDGYRQMSLDLSKVTVLRFRSSAQEAVRRAALREASLPPRNPYPTRSTFDWSSDAPSAGLSHMIDEAARRYQLEPALVHAVVRAESGFNYRAVSSKGAAGLMQLMPSTARDIGVRNVFHPQENVEGGVCYLRSMIDRFGDVPKALAAYNAGPGAVEAYGGIPPYQETQAYVGKVLRYRHEHLLRYGRFASVPR